MNLRTLRTFVEVVRQGGFSQAAEIVALTQSTVSKAVKSLEDELGAPLLNRMGHRSELTDAGKVVYQRALVMLAERNDLLAEINDLCGLRRGVLRIGLPPVGSGVLFAAMFTEYRNRYPHVDIELVEHGSKKLQECLEFGEIDVAALLRPRHDGFDYQDIRIEPLMVVMPIGHPLAEQSSVNFLALATSAFILYEAGFALNGLILGACERQKIVPKITARSAQIDFIVDLVSAGLGVAFLPKMLAQKHVNKHISLVALDEPLTDWHIALAWRKRAHLPPPAAAWLELAKEMTHLIP